MSCIIIRSMSTLADKFMKLCLILIIFQDILIATYGMLVAFKYVIYASEFMYHISGFHLKMCIAAGIIQMISMAAMPGLLTCVAYAYYHGVNSLPFQKGRNIGKYSLVFVYVVIVITGVILLFIFSPYQMTDLCSLIWAGVAPSATHYAVGILLQSNNIINFAITSYFFYKTDNLVQISGAAVRDASGSVFGASVKKHVVRFYTLTCLCPFLKELLTLSVFESGIRAKSFVYQRDLVISLYILPCCSLTILLIYLFRSVFRGKKKGGRNNL